MRNRGGTLQLARIFGIRVGASTSWFVVLFILIFWLDGFFRTLLGDGTQAFVVAVCSALLFFVSLVLHELGHALVARRHGIETVGIDLWLFGGLAKLNGEARTPGAEFAIAASGPLITLAIVGACLAAGTLIGGAGHFLDVALLAQGVHASVGLAILGFMAMINTGLFFFNLVPAYPLDGGRIARALAWRLTGDRNRATRASANVGRAFAYLLAGVGVALLFRGDGADGLWLIALGWVLGQAARGTVIQTKVIERIRAVRVADIMDADPVTIDGATTLADAHDMFFLRYRSPLFAVVDAAGRYLGVLTADRVDRELEAGRPALHAADLADDEAPWRVDAQATLETLLSSEGLQQLGAVAAVDADGFLRGVVTAAQVRRALTPSA